MQLHKAHTRHPRRQQSTSPTHLQIETCSTEKKKLISVIQQPTV